VPSPRDTRTYSDVQIPKISGSSRAFDFTNPILVSEAGDMIGGRCRLAAP
jgi:hypothetical protein